MAEQESELGEDYEAREAKAVDAARKAFGKRFSGRKVVKGFFADLYQNDTVHPAHFSLSTNDSVGSKLMLAHASIQHPKLAEQITDREGKGRIAEIAGAFDTVAIDGIAMNANDIAPWGLAWFDQIMKFTACQAAFEEEAISGDVERGVLRGLELADVSDILGVPQLNLGKCETASLDETITTVDETHGFELVFSGFGYIRKEHVTKNSIVGGALKTSPEKGNVIIGFRSSGPHSNGYTALRLRLLDGEFEKRGRYAKEYTGRFGLDDKIPHDGRTLLEALLEPTMIYTRVMAAICREMPHVYGVNITGNGLQNFNRSGEGVTFLIDNPFEPQPVFQLFEQEVERQFRDGKISEKDKYSTEKLYRKLNMGMGFACIARERDEPRILRLAKEHGIDAKIVGHVAGREEKEPSTRLRTAHDRYIEFKGYG
jgi:phosphoribosylformylglycinamidine cyclo-ligase